MPGQARTVAAPARFPLVTAPGFRSTTLALADPTVRSPVSDSAMLNCYAELDPQDKQYWVEKRPGVATLASVAGAAAGGVGVTYGENNALQIIPFPLAIFGTNLYYYSAGALVPVSQTGTGAGIIAGRAAQFLNVPFDATANYNVVWAANGALWAIVDISLARISYENMTSLASGTGGVPWTAALCDGCAYLDSTLYVMDQLGNIWGSNVGNIGTWVGTTVLQAGGRADTPVCLAQQLEYIIAFKSTSLRCFYDAGAAAQTSGVGSNLAWVEGADSYYGCANAGSVQLIDNTLLWLTNNDKGTPQIARMDALQVKVVSTPPIERLLQHIKMGLFSAKPNDVGNVVYSFGMKRGGHRFYGLTIPPAASSAGPFTVVYDLDQELWSIWTSPGQSYWSVVCTSAHADQDVPGSENPGVFAQDVSSGTFYVSDIDQVYPTDSGTYATVDLYSPNADFGTRRRKQCQQAFWVSDQVSGSSMQIRKSDDDYRSWSPFRTVRLDVKQPRITRWGTFRRRAINIRHAAATPFRIKAGEAQLDLGVD
jgi:hypothetical protein